MRVGRGSLFTMHRKSTCACGRRRVHANGQCRLCKAASNRKAKHGLTQEAYDALQEKQKGKCGICWNPATEIDHDHKTNKVRGLLCVACNTGLGKLGDDLAGLRRAMNYLRRKT